MSDETPETTAPVLRREALLPTERSRGLGTVAVVCTMAGVASGLALATTLMAMQVADSMTVRTNCPYAQENVRMVDVHFERGFLGTEYVSGPGITKILRVLPGTPAEAIALQPGDQVLTVNGERMDREGELSATIGSMSPGDRPTIVFERDGQVRTARPTLISWPPISY